MLILNRLLFLIRCFRYFSMSDRKPAGADRGRSSIGGSRSSSQSNRPNGSNTGGGGSTGDLQSHKKEMKGSSERFVKQLNWLQFGFFFVKWFFFFFFFQTFFFFFFL